MDLQEIEKLMEALEKSKLTRLAIRREGFELELEKELAAAPMHMTQPVAPVAPVMAAGPALGGQPAAQKNATPSPAEEEEGSYITSPMVGCFYLTPSPGDPAFVKVGDEVDETTVICIVEAMKVMNEVKAGKQGRIVEILVKNGEPVEFGTKLFRII